METVLVIDDSFTVRKFAEIHLKRFGFAVLHAEDGPAGLDQAKRHRPGLILLDLVMSPELDGFGVLQGLKADAATRAIPVVIVSGRGDREDVKRALLLGATDYMVKPFNETVLVQKVNWALTAARKKREPAAAPTPTMETLAGRARFHVTGSDGQEAILDVDDIWERIEAGAIAPETLVWRRGMPAWQPAGEVAELAALFPPRDPPADPEDQPPPLSPARS